MSSQAIGMAVYGFGFIAIISIAIHIARVIENKLNKKDHKGHAH